MQVLFHMRPNPKNLSSFPLSNLKNHHPNKFGAYRSCRSGEKMFLIYHVTLSDHVIRGHITFTLIHHCAKFQGHKNNGSRYTISLSASRDNIIKGKYDLVSGSLSTLVITVPTFETCGSCGNEDITFLFCQVTPRDHIIKGTCDLINRSPSA